MNNLRKAALFAGLALIITSTVEARKYPDVTEEGLERVTDSKMKAVYVAPGADLTGYKRIELEEATVAFKKNWQRDQNRNRGSGNRVSDDDMDKIRQSLADAFDEIFIAELTDGGYEMVAQPADDVLRIVPSISNLDITAPDIARTGRVDSYSESSGEMTLTLDLYDSVSGDLIAKGIDRQVDPNRGYYQWQTSVSNKSSADRILKRWAKILREGLDEASAIKPAN